MDLLLGALEILPVEQRDRDAMERFVAGLGHHGVAHLAVLVVLDPVGDLLAQSFPIRHHGRRKDLHAVERSLLGERDASDRATQLCSSEADRNTPC
jgi:hypothetical protein